MGDEHAMASAAHIALLEALDKFDPARGVKFETFLAAIVRGRCLDAAREADHLPRLARVKNRRAAAVAERLTHELGRVPTDDELASLGTDAADLRAHDDRMVRSLDVARTIVNQIAANAHTLPASEPASLHVQPLDRDANWSEVLRGLDQRERLIVLLYYRDERRMHEIGETLGVSESYVSIRLKQILAKLRQRGDVVFEALTD